MKEYGFLSFFVTNPKIFCQQNIKIVKAKDLLLSWQPVHKKTLQNLLYTLAYQQGRRHEFEGARVNALEGGGGVNTVKTQNFEKRWGGCMTPPAPMVAPILLTSHCSS